MRRHAFLLALLIYVTLDLSLAEMPGAFVFEPGDSVETVQGARARGAASLVTVPTTTSGAAPMLSMPPPSMRLFILATPRHGYPPHVVSRLPRAALTASLSDDPH